MRTRSELADVPSSDRDWLLLLPRHLRTTAQTLHDHFELQPARFRHFTRKQIRQWLTNIEKRAWLVEQHSKFCRGEALYTKVPTNDIFIDAGIDAKNVKKISQKRSTARTSRIKKR